MTLFTGGILAAIVVSMVSFTPAASASPAAASARITAAERAGAGTPAPGAAAGSVAACTAYAYHAIRARARVTGMPAACRGLSPSQVTFAASRAIRIASGDGPKSAWRKQAGAAAPWVSSLLSGPAPSRPAVPAGGTSTGTGEVWSRLGFSDTVARVGGLLAWLAAAASGGWILLRWWLAGGGLGVRRGLRRLLHGSASTAPPAVTLGHVGLGLLGLVLWAIFMATGSVPLAWVCVFLLGPVAGLGMTVLLFGLPSPRGRAGDLAAGGESTGTAPDQVGPPAGGGALPGPVSPVHAGTAVLEAPASPVRSPSRRSRGGMPVVAIAAHGVFITVAMMFVILAAIGAG